MAQCTPLGQKEMHYYSRIIKERTIIRGPQKKMLLWPVWSHTDMPKIHRSFHFFLSSDPQYGSPEWQPNTLTLQGQMVPPLPPSKSNLGRDTTTTCAWMRSQHPTACLPVTDPFLPHPPPPPPLWCYLAVLMLSVESLDLAIHLGPWDVLQGWKEKGTAS